MDTVRELSKPGQALAPGSPTASVNNPRWWIDGDVTPARRRLHTRLIDEVRSGTPDLHQDKKAIVLAGPPGAGKSTVLKEVLGDHRGEYLVIDADEFKRSLLHEAQADGSYDDFLIPNEIRERQEAGEKFYPLELASLVHEESSYLARALRTNAIATGDNIVVDPVLSDMDGPRRCGRPCGRPDGRWTVTTPGRQTQQRRSVFGPARLRTGVPFGPAAPEHDILPS